VAAATRPKRTLQTASDDGGDFTDVAGKVYSYEVQKKRAKTWVTESWPKGSQIHLKMQALWRKHGTADFNAAEMKYTRPKTGKPGYPSVKGFCNGYEVSGFPILHVVAMKKSRISIVKFSKPVREVLLEHHPRRTAAVKHM